MAAARASWKGFLKLSLVSCPVALYPAATASDKVSFNMLNKGTLNRLKQQYVDAATGDVVEKEDRIKGYEVAKNEYVVVTDDELAEVSIESSHTVEIEKFVPRGGVDPVYYDGRYYVSPEGKVGHEAFAVVRAAMEERDVVGIARVVLSGKERIVMLEPRANGLMLTTLRYSYEVRQHEAAFDGIPAGGESREMLDLASHLIDAKMGEFKAAEYVDRYQDAVVSLIRAKQTGAAPVKEPPVEKKPDVDLLEALRRSLGGIAPASSARKTPVSNAARVVPSTPREKAGVRAPKLKREA